MHKSGFWVLLFDCLDRIVKNEKYIIFIKAVQSTISSGLINFQVIEFLQKKTEHQINVTTDVNLKILIDTFYYSPA